MQGFQSKIRNGIELQVQQTARLDFSLELGSVEVAVEVTGSAPMINATDATIGTVIRIKRSWSCRSTVATSSAWCRSIPNVSSDWAGGGGGGASGGRGATARPRIFRLPVSGANTTSTRSTGSSIRTSISIRTPSCPRSTVLEEFKVQTGVYSAEFGREVAQVNVSTKSGTNAFHGTIFEFIRNDAFDAAPYQFTSVKPADIAVQVESVPASRWEGRSSIPGLYDGANKLFFMSNYEGFRLRQQQEVVFSTPSVAMRKGDFSGAGVTIRDPQTGQPFPGNQIPRNRLDPIAIKLLEWYPEPNIPGAGLSRKLPRAAAPRDRQGSVHAARRFR